MATFQDVITQIRSESGDYSIKRYETADGDASTTVFQLKHPKISDVSGTITVKISSVVKIENTDYTVNKDYGQIIFTSPPASGNDNISFEYESVNLLNSDLVTIINDILYQKRKKLWLEFDTTSLAFSVAYQNTYALSTFASDIISLNEIEYRVNSNTSSSPWIALDSIANVSFYRTLQKIMVKPVLTVSGYDFRIKGIRAYTRGTTVASTFEPASEYWGIIKKYALAEHWRREAAKRLKEVGAVSKESEFQPVTEIIKLAAYYESEGDKLLKELKLPRPSKKIPYAIE